MTCPRTSSCATRAPQSMDPSAGGQHSSRPASPVYSPLSLSFVDVMLCGGEGLHVVSPVGVWVVCDLFSFIPCFFRIVLPCRARSISSSSRID